ncbi:response regulator transcription factor [Actinomyces wuliandei]|uniref:response regulator transcription factor n=1 Tax=Actinomyces wuliandei TaxID=2057743 RepID=UPI000FDA5B90|nr:response regulator transcription factor [Actinomyces wuliandei]
MRIMVVDDNPIVRAGLQAVLDRVDSVTQVLQAGDAFEALETAAANSPDIVLLDISMPGRSGLDILPELVGRMSVIMLTSHQDPELIQQALEAGARGYLVHGQLGANEVAGAIETCLRGGMVLGREATDVLLNPQKYAPINPLREQVSEREAEILDLAASGLSNREIATRLYLSERTVKNYLNAAYPKIGAHNRTQAVSAWLGRGRGR